MLSAAAIAVGLLISELVAKKVLESEFVLWSVFVPDDKTGWRFKPNAKLDVEWYAGTKQQMVSNRFGYRDSAEPSDIRPGSTVVSIQGDSNVIGYGIQSPSLVSNVLKDLLNKNTQPQKYYVINAGTSGYDLQNYVLQFPEIQAAYHPAYNFVFFNMANDHLYTFLSTPYNMPRPFKDLEGDALKLRRPEYRIKSQLYPLKFIPSMMEENKHVRDYYFRTWNYGYVDGIAAHSYLLYLVGNRLGYENKFSNLIGFHPKAEKVADNDYSEGFVFCMLSRYQETWHPIFDKGQQLLTRLFKTYSDLPSTKTVVVLLPDSLDLTDRKALEDLFKKHNVPGRPNHEPFYTKMKRSIREAGLEYIDLRPIFLKQGETGDLYLKGNGHISPKGHELIAKVIADYISEQGKDSTALLPN